MRAIAAQTTKQAALPSKLFLPINFVRPHFFAYQCSCEVPKDHEKDTDNSQCLRK